MTVPFYNTEIIRQGRYTFGFAFDILGEVSLNVQFVKTNIIFYGFDFQIDKVGGLASYPLSLRTYDSAYFYI